MKHELLSELKRITAILKRTPSVREFRQYKEIKASHEGHFGTWAVFLQAAGLDQVKQEPKIKYDPIEEVLGEYVEKKQPKEFRIPKVLPIESDCRALLLGDAHFPFTDLSVLSLSYFIAESYQPKLIIQLGDLYDMFSHSKFPRSRLTFNPKEEMDLGRRMAEEMWAKFHEVCPDAKLVQILGNHDFRPMKRILETYPEGEIFLTDSFNSKFIFPNVHSVLDPREEYFINDDTIAIHGHSKPGASRDQTHLNVVRGHDHRLWTSFKFIGGKTLHETSCGYMGNPASKAFSYTPSKIVDWHPGVVLLDDFGPHLICA